MRLAEAQAVCDWASKLMQQPRLPLAAAAELKAGAPTPSVSESDSSAQSAAPAHLSGPKPDATVRAAAGLLEPSGPSLVPATRPNNDMLPPVTPGQLSRADTHSGLTNSGTDCFLLTAIQDLKHDGELERLLGRISYVEVRVARSFGCCQRHGE
jgi:hypothetical protein